MTNQALQELIGNWFPNPEAGKVSDVVEVVENEEGSEEKPVPHEPINPSLLEFSEEGSQFLNIFVQPEQLHSLMTQLKGNEQTHFDYLFQNRISQYNQKSRLCYDQYNRIGYRNGLQPSAPAVGLPRVKL